MKNAPKTIGEYIARYPKSVQATLRGLRAAIRKEAPTAGEKIGYGIPTFTLDGNLVHFAAYAHHIGFYPGAAGIAAFTKELSKYETAKGTVQFPIDKPLPLALTRKIVRFRVKQQMAKAVPKKAAKKSAKK